MPAMPTSYEVNELQPMAFAIRRDSSATPMSEVPAANIPIFGLVMFFTWDKIFFDTRIVELLVPTSITKPFF